ncbi:MAG TPA: hypothetical protein VGN55_23780 [Xanthobacteraceae bacterium]|jgi:hypothetical protein
MASWYYNAVQTSFRPAPEGGYVYRCPNPWLFGHWRSFLVNEDQKESLSVHLRARQRLILWLMGLYLLIAFGLTLVFGSSGSAPDPTSGGFYVFVAVALLGMLALALVPHLYLMHKISPMLAQLPRAEAPLSLHEQLFGVAAVISNLHLALGGFGGVLIFIANAKTIVEYLSEGVIGTELIWPCFGLLIGSLLAGYFLYLTILKRKLKRRPS